MARPGPAGDRARPRASTRRSTLGARTVDWVYPESIQTDTEVRVVLAKEAISTGWDCPRAEVLYSERPAKDATHIAQIIGRMVRQPLAHRIATDDALNSVMCYLPLFDRKALTTIKDALEGSGADNGQNRVGADGRAGADGVRAQPAARCIGVRVRRAAAEHPDARPDRQPAAPGPDARAAAGRRRGWRTAAARCRRRPDQAPQRQARRPGLGAPGGGGCGGRGPADRDRPDVTHHHRRRGHRGRAPRSAGSRPTPRDVARDSQRSSTRCARASARRGSRTSAAAPGADRDAVRVRCAALLRLDGVRGALEATATEWVQEQLDQLPRRDRQHDRRHPRCVHAREGADARRPRP